LLWRTRPPRSINDMVDCCPRPGGRPHVATSLHHACWRFGTRLADCGARAAVENTSNRILGTGSPSAARELLTAFHLGLRETGYVGGQNIKIEYRWTEGQYERLPALAAELLQRQVTAIVTTVGSRAGLSRRSKSHAVCSLAARDFRTGSQRGDRPSLHAEPILEPL
jgi:hypothetical protein